MTFATAKLKAESEKFLLVRMNPGRSIVNDMTLVSGTTYNITFPFLTVNKVEVNGIEFTKVSGTPSTNEYSFDSTTGVLTLTLALAISEYQAGGSAEGDIVAFYYLFYTNDIHRMTYEDPEDNTTTVRDWEPRLQGSLSFEITQEDIIDGFLSVGNTSIALLNQDKNFQKYLTDNDSFHRKEIKIWQCLDSTDNIQKFFIGYSISIRVGDIVSISLDNIFSALNDTYYSNSTLDNSIFQSNFNYTFVNPDDDGYPIYKILSRVSKTIKDGIGVRGLYTILAGGSGVQILNNIVEGYRLINTNFNATRGTTANRIWSGCIASDASSDLSESASNVVELTLNSEYRTDVADASDYRAGDNLTMNGNSGYYVTAIDETNDTIDISTAGTSDTVLSNSDALVRPAIPFVQIIDEDNDACACLRYLRDYSISTDSNGAYKITLVDNFEANFAAATFTVKGGLHPEALIYYRVYNHDTLDHASVVEDIIEDIGPTVDDTTVSNANSAQTIKTNFSIPYWGETNFRTGREYIQGVLHSSLTFLSLGADFEIEYHVIDSFSPSESVTEDEIINNSLIQEIDYKDIITTLTFENPHGELSHTDDLGTSVIDTRSEAKVRNDKARFLHGILKEKNITYYVQDLTNCKDRMEDLFSQRRARFIFTTKGINFSTILSDIYTLESSKIVGTAEQKDIKIFSIGKGSNETKLIGLDLLGL